MVPYYVKLAASKLSTLDIVRSVSIQRSDLVVDFVTGLRERFCFAGKPKRPVETGCRWPATEYELRVSDGMPPKIPGTALRIFPRHVLVKTPLLSQRIMVHRAVNEILQLDEIVLPQLLIDQASSNLRAADISNSNRMSWYDFSINPKTNWSPLWIHHFYIGGFTAKQLSSRITKSILNGNKDVSTIDIIFRLGRSYGNPLGYAGILTTLGVKSVLDIHPDCGKMLGCAIAGIQYSCPSNANIDKPLNSGIISNIGLNYVPISEDLKVDLIICDHSMQRYDMSEIRQYTRHLGKSKWKFMSWCNEHKAAELSQLTGKSKPKLVPIRLFKAKPNSYALLW